MKTIFNWTKYPENKPKEANIYYCLIQDEYKMKKRIWVEMLGYDLEKDVWENLEYGPMEYKVIGYCEDLDVKHELD